MPPCSARRDADAGEDRGLMDVVLCSVAYQLFLKIWIGLQLNPRSLRLHIRVLTLQAVLESESRCVVGCV